jgi:hypothetical protein
MYNFKKENDIPADSDNICSFWNWKIEPGVEKPHIGKIL